MKMMAGMQASTTRRIRIVTAMPMPVSAVRLMELKMADGTRDTMLMKMISDMPLPTPRCVMSSPIHMMSAVPTTSVNTTTMLVSQCGTWSLNTTPYCDDWNSNR